MVVQRILHIFKFEFINLPQVSITNILNEYTLNGGQLMYICNITVVTV